MGTRGYYAIIYNGKMYIMYNHCDSYQEWPGLGWALVREIQWGNLKEWKRALENIKVATGTPTEEDKEALRDYTEGGLIGDDDEDWCCE